jgi:hypothetical protein
VGELMNVELGLEITDYDLPIAHCVEWVGSIEW